MTEALKPWQPTPAQLESVCMSYRHDYGLLEGLDRTRVQLQAMEWLKAWQREFDIAAWNTRAPAVPEGWKLVPRDYVTWEMKAASLSVSFPRTDIYEEFDDLEKQKAAGEIFLAMLAVAPEPGDEG
jgi:hypothetical protein